MDSKHRHEIIEVLDCDIGSRQKSAPGPDQLGSRIRGVTREPGSLLVDFDDEAEGMLEAFVEAERQCCAGIDWRIERDAGLRLRISAEVGQLSAIRVALFGEYRKQSIRRLQWQQTKRLRKRYESATERRRRGPARVPATAVAAMVPTPA